MVSMREQIFQYVDETYGTKPEYLWESTPSGVVLRQKSNNKWYAIAMHVQKCKLGLDGDGIVDVINVKCPPELVGSFIRKDGFFEAYHMNKNHWITILLDRTVDFEEICGFLDISYDLTHGKSKKIKTK